MVGNQPLIREMKQVIADGGLKVLDILSFYLVPEPDFATFTAALELGREFGAKYAMVIGAYAEYAAVPAKRLVKVRDGIDAQTAAAVMLQGLTAHYLTHSTYALKPGDTALVHAAAGGVGQLITQVARLRGATVYGTVGSEAKAAIARKAGLHGPDQARDCAESPGYGCTP